LFASLTNRAESTYKSGIAVQANGATSLSYADGNVAVLSAFLGAYDRPNFSSSEKLMLTELLPHMQKSSALLFKTKALQNQALNHQFILDAIGDAAIALNSNGSVCVSNREGERLLQAGRFFGQASHRLIAKGPQAFAFAALLHRVQTSGIAESLCLHCPSFKMPAYVTVSKLPQRDTADSFYGAALLLIIGQPDKQRIASAQQLSQVFRLSAAEARVAHAFAHGQTLEETAKNQGVKITTVKSQMASIHEKLGISRQTDLVRLIMAVPPSHTDEH
jgi:DNA-binding CsgD family transcriptional regulator